MGQVGTRVPLGFQSPREAPNTRPAAVAAALVIRDDRPDRGVRLEQRPRNRCRNDIDRTVFGRKGGEKGRRQHDVAKESRLNDERWHRDENLTRSEEHTSELQSLAYLVCRLLLEKK